MVAILLGPRVFLPRPGAGVKAPPRELFRLRQEDAGLLGEPFTPEQTAAIKEARPPAGRV